MKTAKELELSLLLKETRIQYLNLYTSRLENIINKAIEILESWYIKEPPGQLYMKNMLLEILKGEDNE